VVEALPDAPLVLTRLPVHLLAGKPAEYPLRLRGNEGSFRQDGREVTVPEVVVHTLG